MVGRSDDELVGQYVKDFFPPEDVPVLLGQIGLGRINGQTRFEFYLPHADGGRLPVVIAARQLEDPEGRLRVAHLDVEPWAGGARINVISIEPFEITGRVIVQRETRDLA